MNHLLKNTRYIRITDFTCRICLRETPAGRKVLRDFDEKVEDLSESRTLGEIYEACTGYHPSGPGPMQLCIVCEASLKQFFMFKIEIDNAEAVLKALGEPQASTKSTSKKRQREEVAEEEDDDDDGDGGNAEVEFQETHFVKVERPPSVEIKIVDDDEIEEYYQDEEEEGEFSQHHDNVHLELEYCDDPEKEFVEDVSMIEERLDEETVTEVASRLMGGSKACDKCGKTFTSVSHCEQHKKIHLGIKEFECPECGKQFRTSSQVKSHSNVHHDNRQFKCETCGKGFKTKKTLKGHEETHSTELKYVCTFCNQGYTNKTALRVHTIRRHRVYKEENIPIIDIQSMKTE